jgi:hypothetical protein
MALRARPMPFGHPVDHLMTECHIPSPKSVIGSLFPTKQRLFVFDFLTTSL